MPVATKVYEFDDELERLEEAIDDLAAEVTALDASTERAKALERRGNRLDTHRRGIEWAREEWEVDGVELGGLTAGEYGRLEDQLPDGAGDGATRVYYVAAGTVDAPYVEDDHDATVAAVSQLPIAFARWAEAQINDLTSVGGETGNRFYDSLRAKQDETTSTDMSGQRTS